jgi:hypothetical protein
VKFLAIFLTASTALFADFSYQETAQVTGGSRTTTTHLIKGNRRADLTKGRITVIDLDRAVITEINVSKKTYSVTTFDQLKKVLSPSVPSNFKASTSNTSQTKSIGTMRTKEIVLTLDSENPPLDVTVDAWTGTMPGYGEVTEFDRKLGEKLGFTFTSSAWRMAAVRPEVRAGFEESSKQMNRQEGAPFEYVTKMNEGTKEGTSKGDAQPAAAAPQQSNRGVVEKLERLSKLRRADEPVDQTAGLPANVIEVHTELDNFSTGPADASKFEVPAGFKKIDSEFAK